MIVLSISSTMPLADREPPRPLSSFLCRHRACCPESQMSVDGLRNDSCVCILNVHCGILRSWWMGQSDICSRVLLTSSCLLSRLPSCHPVFPALLWPWIYIGYQSSYQVKHHAVFDIHHLLMGCSLIAAGECLASLLSHWLIHGEGPPTEGPHLLSVLGAPLLTYNGCDTHKKITCRVASPPPSFFVLLAFHSLFTLLSFLLRGGYRGRKSTT